jgi:hypothetical protein
VTGAWTIATGGAMRRLVAIGPGAERLQMPARREEIHRLLGEAAGRRAAGQRRASDAGRRPVKLVSARGEWSA